MLDQTISEIAMVNIRRKRIQVIIYLFLNTKDNTNCFKNNFSYLIVFLDSSTQAEKFQSVDTNTTLCRIQKIRIQRLQNTSHVPLLKL